MSRLRNRNGATLVLVAILAFLLVGIAGFAIDMSRLYVFKAQLQTTADASALAGILEVARERPTNAPVVALQYVPYNQVEKQTATVAASDVEPGTWDFDAQSFTVLPDWTSPALNAIRVTARYPASYTLASVFGSSGRTVQAVSIAALGYVGNTNCLRPWAVSYQSLLDVLYPPAGTMPVTYDLTAADIATLTAMSAPANEITLLSGSDSMLTAGNIIKVVVNDPWNGANSYKDAIIGCSNLPVGPGTWLDAFTGVGGGTTANTLYDLCTANGGAIGSPSAFTCPGEPKVKLAMWDEYNGLPGSNLQVRVKYVGVFAITGFDKGAGTGSKPDQVRGYFTSMASSGGFSSEPTPLRKEVIVQ